MSAVVRDVYRYHHWPERRDIWRSTTNAFQRTPRGEDDKHGIFGSGQYVGFDNKIDYKNRELIRYHHWPNRRNWLNKFGSSDTPTPREVNPMALKLRPLSDRGERTSISKEVEDGPLSERMESDFLRAKNLLPATAPFGTTYTPQLGVKLIGGVQRPYVENLYSLNEEQHPENYGSRVPPVQEIAENPTRVDPRTLAEETKGYFSAQRPMSENIEYGEDNFTSNLHSKPPYGNRPRPDSKTLSPYSNLPPIRANRTKNQKSTVFEKEPWIRRGESPKLQNQTEYNLQYHNGRPISESNRPVNGYHSENNFKMNFQSNEHFTPPQYKAQSDTGANPRMNQDREFLLQRYLPTDRYDSYKLPSDPTMPTAADEDLLVKIIGDELGHLQPDRLYNAYIEATKFDKLFNGWCSFDRLNKALLSQNAAPHPDTLRLISSMFVEPSIPGQVNYERVLKFIEYALKKTYPDLFSKNHEGYGNSSKFYNSSQNPNSSLQNLDPFREKETAKLIRMVHDALDQTGYRLDIERLRLDFMSIDNKRETLSKAQISDVLYQNRVPLQDSIIDDILYKYQQSNGQYSWSKFLDFLEKVQSVQTGLPIPQSKRPLEHARRYPDPHDSWPRPQESSRRSPPNSYRNGNYDSNDYRDPPLTERERKILDKLRQTEEAINDLKNKYKGHISYRGANMTERERHILDQMRKTEAEIYDLKVNHKGLSPSPVQSHDNYETERERRVRQKINHIEEEILDLKYKDEDNQGQNGYEREMKEKKILEEIKKTKDNIDDIKLSNQIMREGMEVSDRGYNWSDKILKLSGQLYAIDEQRGGSRGLLPYNVIIDKTMEFNKYAHMDIPYDVIVRLAQEYKNPRDQVEIFKFLDHLMNKQRWYKPSDWSNN